MNTDNNKVAFLVLASKSPKTLKLLLDSIDRDIINVYVHLDGKVDIDSYIRDSTIDKNYFISERYNVFWGGFNMIRATLSLVDNALKYDNNQAMCLISDDTALLASSEYIYQNAINNPNQIHCWKVAQNSLVYSRYKNFFNYDSFITSPRVDFDITERKITNDFIIEINEIKMLMEVGKLKIDIYSGSQWWMLHRDVLKQILQYGIQYENFTASMKYSAIPDEMYFQTILKNVLPTIDMICDSPMLYDFSRTPKPYLFQSKNDIDDEIPANKLFIRKVSEDFYLL